MIIDDIFEPLYGKFCWGAKKGYGSFLTFDFGEPHLEVRESFRTKDGIRELRRLAYVHGDWYLWIYICDWAIISHEKEKANSASRTREIERALGRLNGQALVQVKVEPDAQTVFTFELGDQLITRPNIAEYGTLQEQWLLYEPSGNVFTLRDDLKYSYNPGRTAAEDEVWIPLIDTKA